MHAAPLDRVAAQTVPLHQNPKAQPASLVQLPGGVTFAAEPQPFDPPHDRPEVVARAQY